VQSTSARDQLDPLVLLTPTLLIFALSFLALRLLLWTLRALDRPVARTRRLPAYLAARRLGRSPGTSFATSLLLVLSVGLVIVSTSYRAIVLRNHEDSAHQQVGADWNVQVAVPDQPLSTIRSLPPGSVAVLRSQPIFDLEGTFPLPPALIAVDPERYAESGWWREDYSDTALQEWLSMITVPDLGVPVSGAEFTATVTAQAPRDLELLVTYQTPEAEVRTATAGLLQDGTHPYEAELEDAEQVLSITVREDGVGVATGSIPLELAEVAVGGEPLDVSNWVPIRWRGGGGTLEPTPDGVSVLIEPGVGHVVGGIAPPLPPLPALVSPGVATSQGANFVATLGGQSLDFRRAAVAVAFPSVPGDFMVVSSPALVGAAARIPEAGLALNEVWATGGDPRPALEDIGLIPGPTESAEPIIAALAQLPQSLAVGMNFASAVGGLGLVILGVGVGLYFAQRRREFEFASLRAMGTVPNQVTRVLLLEQGLMIVFAIAAGAFIGFGILRLLMPYVGRSLGAAFPAPVLVVDYVSLGIALSAIVAATAIGLLAALRALLRTSVTSVLRGEAE
jgi:hypothetical protein